MLGGNGSPPVISSCKGGDRGTPNKLASKISSVWGLWVWLRDPALHKVEKGQWMISDIKPMCTHTPMYAHTCKPAQHTCIKMKREKIIKTICYLINHNGIKLEVDGKRNYANTWIMKPGQWRNWGTLKCSEENGNEEINYWSLCNSRKAVIFLFLFLFF